MTFSIIIPAYNEEKSIQSIIERTKDASFYIVRDADVEEVEIIVVNDGSTDRTRKIAQQFVGNGVQLLSHEKNKGYGAAIKYGFEKARGDVLGFLDADGTCDPLFFSVLINSLVRNKPDIS